MQQSQEEQENTQLKEDLLSKPASNSQILPERERDSTEPSVSPETMIKKLRAQNLGLRTNLKELNERLNLILSKQERSNKSKPEHTENNNEATKMELENAYKLIKHLQADLNLLKSKSESINYIDKIGLLENDLRNKNQEIEALKKDYKLLEKLQKSQEKIIQASKNIEEETFVKKINNLATENNAYKEKIKEIQEKLRIQEKTAIKQQERYAILEEKYREIQGQKKVETATRSESLKKKAEENGKIEFTRENFDKLANDITILQKSLRSKEKLYKQELEKSRTRIVDLEEENQRLSLTLKDREKECNILRSYIKTHNRQLQNNDADVLENELMEIEEVKDKLLKSSQSKKPAPKTIKYDSKGPVQPTGRKFTDRGLLKDAFNAKINCLRVWFDSLMIKGFQATYQFPDGKLMEGPPNVVLREANYSLFTFQLDNFDYIKSIGGALGENGLIEYLFFASCKGKKADCGQKNDKNKGFLMNILSSEVPVCLYGCLVPLEEKGEEVLDAGLGQIGCEITNDEVEEEILMQEYRKK